MTLKTGFLIASYALSAYAIYRAVTRRHGVEGTLAWVFAIVAFPGVGAAAYLLLANPYVRRTTRRLRRTRAQVRRALAVRESLPDGEEKKLEWSILELASSLTGLSPTAGNAVTLLVENDLAFEQIRNALLGAKQSIWAEYYLIRNDETGHRFLDLLAQKSREGVEVRLLYDAVGSLGLDSHRLKEVVKNGGRAEAFLPLNPFRRRWAIHLRNHRKIIIVDGEIAFTGGMNIGDEYSGRARKKGGQTFHDTHLALKGPAVGDLGLIFAEDWNFATGESLAPPPPPLPLSGQNSVAAMVPSGPDQEHNANGMVFFAGIASAWKRVYLSSPYFIPDEATIRALQAAALRGVDVRLLVPGRNDVALVGIAAHSYYPALMRAGVKVYEYQPAMLHAKTMTVDGVWGVVGSANLDIRSFRLNFELGALVADPEFAQLLEERFLKDLKDSVEISKNAVSRRPFPRRLRESAARLLSPLL